jgi:uncharacterized membrane protein
MSDLVKSLIAGISTNDTIAKMRQDNEEKAEKKRQELAGAITRLVVNDALREMQARKKIFEETKGESQE